MKIKELELSNYKRFKNIHLSFKSGVNLIVGPNASGKTSIVEAIGFAIYGEISRGTNLLNLTKYGSDSSSVKLVLINSEEIEVLRKIEIINKSAVQRILFNGQEVKLSNLNKLKKMFIEKDLFYELVSVDQLRLHNFLDLHHQSFLVSSSERIFPWNIQRVMDNSKSLRVHLKSGARGYEKNLEESKIILDEINFLMEKLRTSLNEKENLTKELREIEKNLTDIEEKSLSTIDRKTLSVIETLENDSRYLRNISKQLKKRIASLNQTELPLSDRSLKFIRDLKEYLSRRESLFLEVRKFSEFLSLLLMDGEHFKSEMREFHNKLAHELSSIMNNRKKIEMQLYMVSERIRGYEETENLLKLTTEKLDKYRIELEKFRKLITIERKLEELINSFWGKKFTLFLSRLANRVQFYLKNLDIDMEVILKEDKMKTLINGEPTDFDVLSAGEKTLLNLLIRIALIKEMEINNIIIFDDPVTNLDKETTLKVFSFLGSLKKDFNQIIITTTKEPLIEFDNKFVLDKTNEV